MKLCAVVLYILFLCFFSVPVAFAQTATPTPHPTGEITNSQPDSSILNSFISGFDWISSGLIFYTPSLLDSTIKLQDGTELTGMSTFRAIFYDIAVPLFVLITSFVAFRHISNDNAMQLQQFFKRLALIVALFIITPVILSYSIQFTNLLNEKIISSNAYNLSAFVNDYLNGFVKIPVFQQLFGAPIALPSYNTILQTIILIISIGFLLIGFIYIVFQAVIRFIALLVLSVIFPVVLPFALSEKTENITNTYFRTWFSFLIQQPAFVLGFAIVSTILASISQAHNNSIGTLFVYSGSLIFLGGINVFIGRIFGEGWSLMTTSAQSMIGARSVNRGAVGIARNEKVKRIPSYTGKAVSFTTKAFVHGVRNLAGQGNKTENKMSPQETRQKLELLKKELTEKNPSSGSSKSSMTQKNEITNKTLATSNNINQNDTQTKQDIRGDKRTAPVTNQAENLSRTQKTTPRQPKVATRRESKLKPITLSRSGTNGTTEKVKPIQRAPRRKMPV